MLHLVGKKEERIHKDLSFVGQKGWGVDHTRAAIKGTARACQG